MDQVEKITPKKAAMFGIKPLTPFQKNLTIYIILNLIILIGGNIYISKFSKKIADSSLSIVTFKDNQSNANTLMEYIAKLEKENRSVEPNFEIYKSRLVDFKDLSKVKKQILDICLKNKVDPLLNMLTLNLAKEKEQASYGFTITLSGPFDRIIKTVKEINSLPIFIGIDQVTFEKNVPKAVAEVLEENLMGNTTNDPTNTTKPKTVKKVTTTKPTDVFKVNIWGRIYLKENLNINQNELKK
jgi:hypothetical protein